MKKIATIFVMMIGASMAALAIWDRIPPEKKRRYIDATDAYRRWNSYEA